MSRNVEIDAVSSLESDRGASELGDVKGKSLPGAKIFVLIVLAFMLGLLVFFIYRVVTRGTEPPVTAAVDTGIRNQMPGLKQTDTPTPAPPPIVPEVRTEARPVQQRPANPRNVSGEPVKTRAQLLRERRLSSELSGDSGMTPTQATYGDSIAGTSQMDAAHRQGQGNGSIADRLSPVRLSSATAGHVGSMDLLLLQSAMIDCALNTRIDSTVPGMMSCDATRDIYSSNGRTVLLDRGTRFTGRYEQGITRGQPRIFVVWERAVTPHGVIINLDSPGTDPLGGAGVPGKVSHHFWRRFGAAILISVFEDAGDYVIARANENGGTYIGNTTRAASDNSSIVLQNSVNIPPTLTKRHGDRINIFVARDLDFRGIYDLRRRP